MGDRQYSDAQRERYLKSLDANGRIPTDSGKYLANEIGAMLMVVDVRVDYVSAVVGDVVYATIATPDGTGKALVILDAQDHAEACGWMAMETVTLAGEARLLFEQPAIDLRRIRHGSQTPAETAHEGRNPFGPNWSIQAITRNFPEMVADIEDLFDSLDYQALFNTVLDHRQVDFPVAIRALDDVLGEIPAAAPYADEDGDL